MATPSITAPIATSKTNSCQLNLPWFVECTEYPPVPATFEPLVNGERTFSAVYDAIWHAKSRVEIICWGFQPSMYFKRGKTCSLCIADLLIKKANEGVQVRILCWYHTLRVAQKTARDIKRDVPAAQYYETLMNDLAKTRAQVARLEKELPAKDQADVSRVDIEGLKVHICSLVAPNSPPDNWMDVYVHSKLMIVDDVFTTLGSANVNTRSMQVDSELNIWIEDPAVTRPLREHLFGMHTAGAGAGSDMNEIYENWQDILSKNKSGETINLQSETLLSATAPTASLIEFMQESSVRKNLD